MKIFVSYSRRDAGDFANQIQTHLSIFNYYIFTDVDSINAGEIWNNTIEENISNCDIFVVIVTHGSLQSPHVEREVLQAQKENKTIIPCFHKDVLGSNIKWDLNKIQGLEFKNEYQLARELYSKIDKIKAITTKSELSNIPRLQIVPNVSPQTFDKGYIIFASSQSIFEQESYSYADKSQTHSAFSFYLHEGLVGKAANPNNGIITIGNLKKFMDKISIEKFRQTPYYITNGKDLKNINILETNRSNSYFLQENFPEKRRAIVIGISNYESNQIPHIPGAKNDAKKIYDILVRNGNFVVSDKHCLLGSSATRKNVFKALSDIFRKDNESDLVVVYFSGHGVIDIYGEGYLAPYDMDLDDPIISGIHLRDFKNIFENMLQDSKNKSNVIIFLDCLYSGVATRSTK